MPIPRVLTVAVAVLALAITVILGLLVVQPPRPLITDAGFAAEQITPNADGDNDATVFSYTLARNALITLTLRDAAGDAFTFRQAEPRTPGEYNVVFSGIVHGYTLPGEAVSGQVDRRLLQNGDYTWTLTAITDNGESAEASGTLVIAGADAALPELPLFSLPNEPITPNQDGIADRAVITVRVTKDATLSMSLQGDDGSIYYIAERNEGVLPGEAGQHVFDYDGGIDAGQEPPPDGVYRLLLLAEDAVGQRVSREGTLELREGGTPIGGIYTQTSGTTVFYGSAPYDEAYTSDINGLGEAVPVPEGVQGLITDLTVVEGDMLIFRVTISNDGNVGLRTAGPPPGTVYNQEQRASSLGFYAESGAWRVGLECDTADASYPWRWAIGSDDELEHFEYRGKTYSYLPPGGQAVVWGAVRLTDAVPSRNPQQCFIGLIHEDVAVTAPNIEPRWVEIVPAPSAPANTP